MRQLNLENRCSTAVKPTFSENQLQTEKSQLISSISNTTDNPLDIVNRVGKTLS